MFTGNKAKVMSDAATIVRLLRAGRITVTALMRQYRCGYTPVIKAILSRMTESEYLRIKRNILARRGLATRFAPGHRTWNKGLKGIHLSPASEFKKGCLRGQAARNWRPIGAITIRYDKLFRWQRSRSDKNGGSRKGKPRRWIKVRDDGPSRNRWIPYARFLWEQQHGPTPAGYIVVHRDGNQMTDVIDNLIIVNRKRHLSRTCHTNPEVTARRTQHAAKTRKRNTQARRILRRRADDAPAAWYCPACGYTHKGHKPPDRCSKCAAHSFERISVPLRKAIAVG